MSDCSMTSEMVALVDAFGWGLDRMQWLTTNAMKSSFLPFDERLGHGVRIRDDISHDADGRETLGLLAAYVRDRRIPLEVCPSSNVHTGVSPTIREHPIKMLVDLRFRVTVNTDNRLMSDCSMTSEMAALADAFGWGLDRMRWLTINAMKSSFLPFDERLEIIEGVIKKGYLKLGIDG